MESKTILFVDDEEDIRLVVSALLQDAGYRVLTAGDAAEGRQIALSEFPDLVVSDVMMPGESGYNLCAKLKEDAATKDIPVVFLSVMEDEQRGIEAGATAFLTKPFEEEELLSTVKELLQQPVDLRQLLNNAVQDLRNGNTAEGLQGMQTVIETDAKSPLAVWARYYIGMVELTQGDKEKASQSFSDALGADPSFFRAHNRLGVLFSEAGDRARAIKHLERSLALNANQPEARDYLDKLTTSG